MWKNRFERGCIFYEMRVVGLANKIPPTGVTHGTT
jgi:hypothetical protein